MILKGTKTEKNLMNSYLGEVSGKILYGIFSEQAKKEEYHEISKKLNKLANEELAHSLIFKKCLVENNINFQEPTIDTAELKKMCKSTYENLTMASSGEYKAYEVIYPEYEKIAFEEGFVEIAKIYSNLGKVELIHGELLEKLSKEII